MGCEIVAQVPAHLVQAAGLGHREDERAAIDGRARERAEAGDGVDARAPFGARDRVVDDEAIGGRAAHEREVPLRDAPLFERAPHRRRRLARAREDERAARAAIEPVEREDVAPAERVAHAEHRDVVVAIPPAVHEQPRRLVRDDDVRVDVEEIDRAARARRSGDDGVRHALFIARDRAAATRFAATNAAAQRPPAACRTASPRRSAVNGLATASTNPYRRGSAITGSSE